VLAEHLEALVTGFCSAYEVLAQGRSTWVQDVLATAESAHNRAVLRPTYVYASLLQSLLAPDALRSVAAQSLVLERLARAYVDAAGEPSWSLAAAEQEALSRLDVPYFTWAVTGGETRWWQGSLSGWPAHDQLAEAQRRAERLGEEDLRRQVALIRASVAATAFRMMPGPVSPPLPLIASPVPVPVPVHVPVPVPVHALARRSFASTADAAFSVRGQATWMGLSLLPDGVHANVASIGSGLYDGRMGLAAGFRLWAHADPDSRDQALELSGRAVEPLMELLIDPHRVHRLGLGNGVGFAGVGGLLRGLAFLRSGEVVDGPERILDEQLEAAAGALVASLDPGSLRDDARIDLMSGVAGVVTPLTRLLADASTGAAARGKLTDLIAAAGHSLVARQDSDTGAWQTLAVAPPLTGVAHGASGIALALAEAGVALAEAGFVEAAARGLRYEARVFDAGEGNWPDFRPASGAAPGQSDATKRAHQGFMMGWCAGAPGIVLTRLRLLELLPDHPDAPTWSDELNRGARTTATAPLLSRDHLCCGNLGRTAILRTLAAQLGEPAWARHADRIAVNVAATAGLGLPRSVLGADIRDLPLPGLFTGLPGAAAALFGRTDWVPQLLL
jgi:type 2 lantibiotic biosynthesis protein LanM